MLKVDVLLPVYNPDNFFFSALLSVVNQERSNFNHSIIVIQNGPKNHIDVEKICSNFDCVNYFYISDPSLVNALNFGVQISDSDYICRMDADDISYPNRIHTLLSYMLLNNLDICGSDINVFSNNSLSLRQYPTYHNDILNHLCVGSPFCHPSVMFKTSIIKKLKYRHVSFGEDFDLWLRASEYPILFGNVPYCLLNYRVHFNQLSNNFEMLNVQNDLSSNNTLTLQKMTPFITILDAFKLSKIDFLTAFKYIVLKHKSPKLFVYIMYVKMKSFF